MANPFRTSNPAFGNRYERYLGQSLGEPTGEMTIEGTVTKTGILLILVLISALVVGSFASRANFSLVFSLMTVGIIGGFVVALLTIFLPKWAAITTPAYAVLEGLVLGGVSAVFGIVYPGIVFQAVALTFGVFALMLVLYRFKILRATPRFVKGVIAATGAIFVVYFIGLILTLFRVPVFFWSSSDPISIGFSVLVVAIAALNFVLDFANVEAGVQQHAPKNMEWYAAFGLLVTLVWLYIEILRLLAKVRGR